MRTVFTGVALLLALTLPGAGAGEERAVGVGWNVAFGTQGSVVDETFVSSAPYLDLGALELRFFAGDPLSLDQQLNWSALLFGHPNGGPRFEATTYLHAHLRQSRVGSIVIAPGVRYGFGTREPLGPFTFTGAAVFRLGYEFTNASRTFGLGLHFRGAYGRQWTKGYKEPAWIRLGLETTWTIYGGRTGRASVHARTPRRKVIWREVGEPFERSTGLPLPEATVTVVDDDPESGRCRIGIDLIERKTLTTFQTYEVFEKGRRKKGRTIDEPLDSRELTRPMADAAVTCLAKTGDARYTATTDDGGSARLTIDLREYPDAVPSLAIRVGGETVATIDASEIQATDAWWAIVHRRVLDDAAGDDPAQAVSRIAHAAVPQDRKPLLWAEYCEAVEERVERALDRRRVSTAAHLLGGVPEGSSGCNVMRERMCDLGTEQAVRDARARRWEKLATGDVLQTCPAARTAVEDVAVDRLAELARRADLDGFELVIEAMAIPDSRFHWLRECASLGNQVHPSGERWEWEDTETGLKHVYYTVEVGYDDFELLDADELDGVLSRARRIEDLDPAEHPRAQACGERLAKRVEKERDAVERESARAEERSRRTIRSKWERRIDSATAECRAYWRRVYAIREELRTTARSRGEDAFWELEQRRTRELEDVLYPRLEKALGELDEVRQQMEEIGTREDLNDWMWEVKSNCEG